MSSPEHALPFHERLVDDLNLVRRSGLVRLRGLPLDGLYEAAGLCGLPGESEPSAVEELLRRAIDGLGGGDLSDAAKYTFGTASGTRGWTIGDRRRRAAQSYGVSVERFRKHHERLVIEQVAEEIGKLCRARPVSDGGPVSRPLDLLQQGQPTVTLPLPGSGATRQMVLHVAAIELLRDIDVIVSSENVAMEMSKLFKQTVSAALRRAGAKRNTAGEIIDDTIQRELTEWVRQHGRVGFPVTPGTVAVTGPGALANEGIRRIYHAGVATPRTDGDDYSVSADVVAIALRNVFRLATRERDAFSPPLSSICLPLFGAGHGGVPATTSFAWIRAALDHELPDDAPWRLHLVTHSMAQAEDVVRSVTNGTA